MVESRHPNRWFGSNPQALSNHGKKLSPWERELPKNWREALGLEQSEESQAESREPAEGTGA
jgi:hypothetical protein